MCHVPSGQSTLSLCNTEKVVHPKSPSQLKPKFSTQAPSPAHDPVPSPPALRWRGHKMIPYALLLVVHHIRSNIEHCCLLSLPVVIIIAFQKFMEVQRETRIGASVLSLRTSGEICPPSTLQRLYLSIQWVYSWLLKVSSEGPRPSSGHTFVDSHLLSFPFERSTLDPPSPLWNAWTTCSWMSFCPVCLFSSRLPCPTATDLGLGHLALDQVFIWHFTIAWPTCVFGCMMNGVVGMFPQAVPSWKGTNTTLFLLLREAFIWTRNMWDPFSFSLFIWALSTSRRLCTQYACK